MEKPPAMRAGAVLFVRAGQCKRGKNYFRPLPSIESLRSKVFLKARTELFKVGLAPLATRLSSCTTNDG